MVKRISLSFVFIFAAFLSAKAQSAGKIEEITASKTLLKGQACYLVGTAAGSVADTGSINEAFAVFSNLKMFKKAASEEEIRLDEFANLALQGLKIKGGLWYRAAKNPHYAFRQFKIMGIISRKAAPSSSISPQEALKIINILIERFENNGHDMIERAADEKAVQE